MRKTLLKFLKFIFSKELEIAPGVFWLGGYVYENRNKPTGKPPLKLKKTDSTTGTGALENRCSFRYDTPSYIQTLCD